ncbi:MAG: hypothetical protein KBD26_00905 [Candidatus Pacebacteria bacterium]|nr:hypothetical protein [Candidatus Paceibacterota bacterium]MBP9772370.1 hypothetical protein [Candidatus Paceibacterota bacterium]
MKIGKLLISWDRGGVSTDTLENVDKEYEKGLSSGKKLILGTLAARSGTRVFGDIINAHKNATGITERYFEAESMYRYIKYNKLPIDTSGIITLIKKGIVDDWKRGDIAFVNSPFFSHGIKELHDVLKPSHILFAINNPEFTVQSIYNKGFFSQKYIRTDNNLALGFQPSFPQKWYWLYLFARLVPNGDFYNEWSSLTRIGKISWWGSMVNREIWDQLKDVPKEKVIIFDLDEAIKDYYPYYTKIATKIGLSPLLSEKVLQKIRNKGIKSAHNEKHTWSEKEKEEFIRYSKDWFDLYKELRSNNI